LCTEPFELGVVGRALCTVAVDKIQQAAADALDRRRVQRLAYRRNAGRLCTERDRTRISRLCIDDAECHRRCAGTVLTDEIEAMAARLLVDEIVDVALPVERDLLGPVPRDRLIAHQLEQPMQGFGIRMRILDEFEAVGAHRIVGRDGGGWRVVRKRSHWLFSVRSRTEHFAAPLAQSACKVSGFLLE
jgi:hypothetical protein